MRGESSSFGSIRDQSKGYFPTINPQPRYQALPSNQTSAPHLVVNINTTNNFGPSNFGKVPEDPVGSMSHHVAEILNANLPAHLSKLSKSVDRSDNPNRYEPNEDIGYIDDYGRGLGLAAREANANTNLNGGDRQPQLIQSKLIDSA